MSQVSGTPQEALSSDERIDQICTPFEVACKAALGGGPWPLIEDALAAFAESEREALLRELVLLDVHYRQRDGQNPKANDYQARFPEFEPAWLTGASALPSTRPSRPTEPALPVFGAPADGELSAGAGTIPRRLGDYRILREIGRGGMGVVYEAIQESLGRHVALKVLPFNSLLGPTHLERFQREARAAAKLHHTNIVPVFGVGEHEGIHYYAMQFIQGHGLDVVLQEVRRLRGPKPGSTVAGGAVAHSVAEGLVSGRFSFAVEGAEGVSPLIGPAGQGADAPRSPGDGPSEITSQSQTEYFRSVARLGVQVAEGLAYAHRQGILHRDIKPSNLLLDTAGTVWITDFGLAKAEDSQELTHPGDVVGTLRYMAPERLEGRSDPRSDVYSLGLTLYELLTLRPALDDSQRARLIERIRYESPPLPSKIDRRIPRDLETIVLKAVVKEPGGRYATAEALAEDLRRFLADRPIQARRTPLVEQAWRWCRRNPVVAALAVLIICVTALGFGLVTWQWRRAESAGQTLADQARELAYKNYYQNIALAADQRARGNVGRAEELLDSCQADLRGWEWHCLKRQRYDPPRGLPHAEAIISIAHSADGRYLASGCLDGTVTVWDTRTWNKLWAKQEHGQHVYGLAFSPDSRFLSSAGHDKQILVWEVASGELWRNLPGHTDTVVQLAYSPDGRELASASLDKTVRLWDVEAACSTHILSSHDTAVRGLAFRIGDGRLISAGADGRVCVWDTTSDHAVATYQAQIRWVSCLALSLDGQLALAGWDGSVELWDALPCRERRTLRAHTAFITSLAFSPDGQRLASAGDDKMLKLWDTRTGQEAIVFDFNQSRIQPVTVAFSPDGLQLAAGMAAKKHDSLVIWDGTPLSTKPAKDQGVTLAGHDDAVVRVAFCPGRSLLASASRDTTVKLWNTQTGAERFTFRGHTAIVSGVTFRPDGKRVASGSWDGEVKIWDPQTGAVSLTLRPQEGFVDDVAFSSDGKLIASAHSTGVAALWDARTGDKIRDIPAHKVEACGVAFSADGRYLATAGGRGHDAKVWGVPGGELICNLGNARLWGVAFSPDSKSIATANGTGTVTIWDAQSGHEIRTLVEMNVRVCAVAFSPDGRFLASGHWDQKVRVWEVATGRRLVELYGHAGHVLGVAFSADGRQLASCAGYKGRGEIKIWDASLWEKPNGSPGQ